MSAGRGNVLALALLAGCFAGCEPGGALGDNKPSRPPLTQGQARVLATKLANQAFLDQRFVDNTGRPVQVLIGSADWTDVRKRFWRWRFTLNPDEGPQATVTFDLDGSDPRVRIGYNPR